MLRLVGIETEDDIVIKAINDEVTGREQDKHSISDNVPFGDSSKDLWNTLNIWCKAVIANEVNVEICKFHLVTNKILTEGIARRMGRAETDLEALIKSFRHVPVYSQKDLIILFLIIEHSLLWTKRVTGANSRSLWEIFYNCLDDLDIAEVTQRLAEVIQRKSLNCDSPAEILGNSALTMLLDQHISSDKAIWQMGWELDDSQNGIVTPLDKLIELAPPKMHFSYHSYKSGLRSVISLKEMIPFFLKWESRVENLLKQHRRRINVYLRGTT